MTVLSPPLGLPVRRLLAALRRLLRSQGAGARARRNARSAAASALRAVRAAVDERFPPPDRRPARRARDFAARVRAAEKAGYEEVIQRVTLVEPMALAGVRPRRVVGRPPNSIGRTAGNAEWVGWPGWAVELAAARVSSADLRRARSSQKFRRALLVRVRLVSGGS